MSDLPGLLVLDKPAGITSNQLVGQTKRRLGTRKVGHAGTLDPMATGVMILGSNRATRLLGYLLLHDKSYLATIRLGQATDTDDAEGTIISTAGAAGLTPEQVSDALPPYRGDITQVPSTYSAIKVDGRRAYDLARAGETVALKGRSVHVARFDLLDVRPAIADGLPVLDVDVVVDCSSGTYIRALARDLGADLGTGGHLTALRRTRVGGFTLDDASEELIPMLTVAERCFPIVEIDAATARDVGYGRPIEVPVTGPVTAIVHDGQFLALYEPTSEGARPVAVLVG